MKVWRVILLFAGFNSRILQWDVFWFSVYIAVANALKSDSPQPVGQRGGLGEHMLYDLTDSSFSLSFFLCKYSVVLLSIHPCGINVWLYLRDTLNCPIWDTCKLLFQNNVGWNDNIKNVVFTNLSIKFSMIPAKAMFVGDILFSRCLSVRDAEGFRSLI